MKKQLHSGAKWQFRIRGYFIGIIWMFILGWIIISPSIIIIGGLIGKGAAFATGAIIATVIIWIVAVIIIGEIYSRMSYNRWFYEFTENNLKVEQGIIWKRYSNIPYDRVQNVDIQRGIIARILGFSSVMVQTAGYSGQRGMSEGYIPAVSTEEAEKIREFLMKKIGKKSKGGL